MTRRAEAKAATGQAVLDAAKALFETVGYEAATIREVARRAGYSTGAIFNNYPGKAELYAAVYGHPPITPEEGLRLKAEVERLKGLLDRREAA